MGLGKTLHVLAVIVANPAPGVTYLPPTDAAGFPGAAADPAAASGSGSGAGAAGAGGAGGAAGEADKEDLDSMSLKARVRERRRRRVRGRDAFQRSFVTAPSLKWINS